MLECLLGDTEFIRFLDLKEEDQVPSSENTLNLMISTMVAIAHFLFVGSLTYIFIEITTYRLMKLIRSTQVAVQRDFYSLVHYEFNT